VEYYSRLMSNFTLGYSLELCPAQIAITTEPGANKPAIVVF